MRRAPFMLLFVTVLSAGLGLVVQSTLRGQETAGSSTPPAAAAPASRDAALDAAVQQLEQFRRGPGMVTAPRRAGDQEAWQAQQEIPNLLAKYGETTDEKERAKIKEGLSKVLAKLFDLQQKERESEIADIEGRVRRLREMLDKRTKARQSIITNRLEQLLREAEGLGWVEPAPAGMSGMGARGMGMYGGMGMGYGPAAGSRGSVEAGPAETTPLTPSSEKPAAGAAPKGSSSRRSGR